MPPVSNPQFIQTVGQILHLAAAASDDQIAEEGQFLIAQLKANPDSFLNPQDVFYFRTQQLARRLEGKQLTQVHGEAAQALEALQQIVRQSPARQADALQRRAGQWASQAPAPPGVHKWKWRGIPSGSRVEQFLRLLPKDQFGMADRTFLANFLVTHGLCGNDAFQRTLLSEAEHDILQKLISLNRNSPLPAWTEGLKQFLADSIHRGVAHRFIAGSTDPPFLAFVDYRPLSPQTEHAHGWVLATSAEGIERGAEKLSATPLPYAITHHRFIVEEATDQVAPPLTRGNVTESARMMRLPASQAPLIARDRDPNKNLKEHIRLSLEALQETGGLAGMEPAKYRQVLERAFNGIQAEDRLVFSRSRAPGAAPLAAAALQDFIAFWNKIRKEHAFLQRKDPATKLPLDGDRLRAVEDAILGSPAASDYEERLAEALEEISFLPVGEKTPFLDAIVSMAFSKNIIQARKAAQALSSLATHETYSQAEIDRLYHAVWAKGQEAADLPDKLNALRILTRLAPHVQAFLTAESWAWTTTTLFEASAAITSPGRAAWNADYLTILNRDISLHGFKKGILSWKDSDSRFKGQLSARLKALGKREDIENDPYLGHLLRLAVILLPGREEALRSAYAKALSSLRRTLRLDPRFDLSKDYAIAEILNTRHRAWVESDGSGENRRQIRALAAFLAQIKEGVPILNWEFDQLAL